MILPAPRWPPREPLVLFALVGALLYGVWGLFSPPDRTVVRIDPAALRAIETQREQLLGRSLTSAERERVREDFIENEVLLREALRRGLQWSDARVRQRLVSMMRGAFTETVPDPSVAQLQAWFRDNMDRYTKAESFTFEQVVFPWGDEVGEERLAKVLAELRGGAAPERFGGTLVSVDRHLPRQTRADLVRAFGADFTDRILPLPLGEWQGPVESPHGIHIVRLVERHEPEPAVFEEIEAYLRQDWLLNRTRELQQARVDEIRSGYRIELPTE